MGVFAPHADRLSLTPPPPPPPHKGEESRSRTAERRKEPISDLPDMGEGVRVPGKAPTLLLTTACARIGEGLPSPRLAHASDPLPLGRGDA